MTRAALLALLALPAFAAAQSCRISLPVTLLNRSGNPFLPLTPADLQVKQPRGAAVVALAPASPRRVELLIDGSGSLAAKTLWSRSENIAAALLATAPAGIAVGLDAFGDQLRAIAPFRSPAAAYEAPLARAYRGFHPTGGTAFFDVLAQSVASRAGLRPGDAILAISDGDDDTSHISASSAARALEAAGVRLFLFHLGDEPLQSGPKDMIRDSGGEVFAAYPVVAPRELALRAWILLQDEASVTVTLPAGRHGALRLAPARTLQHARLLAARPRFACPR